MSKKGNMSIEFIGPNSEDVTGSMTLIKSKGLNILLEAGIYQSSDVLEEYKVNNRNLNISVKKIDYIILGHIHADHSMLIPRLYAEGCNAKIITPKGNRGLLKLMGLDSVHIIETNCYRLEKKYKKSFHRMYEVDDVYTMLSNIQDYPMGRKIKIDDRLYIRFTPSGHIINAAQTELWVSDEKHTKTVKILYTSDLGNIKLPKYYAEEFEPIEKANIVIGETTYAMKESNVCENTRKKDIEKIEEVITHNKGIVEIPIYTLDRGPNILTVLYDIFGNKRDFKQDVVVDSPLAVKMLFEYLNILEGDDYEKLKEVLEWKNLILIEKGRDSKAYMSQKKNCVVLSASGMLNAGRSRIWLKNIVDGSENTLMFVGYSSNNTLAAKVKETSKGKGIKIDNKTYQVNCNVVDLRSFTSHMQNDNLLDYYSSISTDKICLVHGDFSKKCDFGTILQEKIDNKYGRARVVVVNKGTKINL